MIADAVTHPASRPRASITQAWIGSPSTSSDASLTHAAIYLAAEPKPGLLFQAAEKYNIDFSKSWMVGDSISDMEAGKAAECRTLLLKQGTLYENLKQAVDYILQGDE